jgi:hypothetical protein
MNEHPTLRRGLLAAGSGAIAGLVAAPGSLKAAARPPDGRLRRSSEVIPVAGEQAGEMAKHEVGFGVVIAYEDRWFGAPLAIGGNFRTRPFRGQRRRWAA